MLGRLPRISTRLLSLVCLLALALTAAGCGSSSPARATWAQSNLESIFEDEALLHANPTAAFATFRSLGVDRVRVYVPWSALAPDPTAAARPRFDAMDPNAYPAASWAIYDEIVRAAAAAHVGIDMTLGPPAPLWAGGRGAPAHSIYKPEWKTSAPDFGAFVHAVGLRYSGRFRPAGSAAPLPRVNFWAIWNEPNYGPYLAPQAIDHSTVEVSPRLYRGLLDAAWSALLATGHGPRTDTILIGETAPRGLTGPNLPGNFSGMVPLRFIRALYCVSDNLQPLRGAAASERGCPASAAAGRHFASEHPALFQAGGFADHPYPDSLPPNVRTPPPVGTDYADFAAIGELERTLDRAMRVYGVSRRLPIYSTEFGYKTDPPASLGVVPALAARYLNQAEYLSWRDPRIRSYDQYLMTDPAGHSPGLFATGLRFNDGQRKPEVFDAYRMPLYLPSTTGSRGRPLEVWGDVRPAPGVAERTGRAQHVAIQFAPAGSASFRTVRSVTLSDPHGYFDVRVVFRGSGTVRLAWASPGGLEVSRTQAIRLG